jgi:hypothetical protein
VSEQLSLDFSVSATMRMRKAKKAMEVAEAKQAPLFIAPPNIDVHLHSPLEAIADIAGSDPDRTIVWLSALVGPVRMIKSKKVAFPSESLDRLLYVRPPAHVTLDAASTAVARGIWGEKLGLKPLVVVQHRKRLMAASVRWPTALRVTDAPWTAIATLMKLKVKLSIDSKARQLMTTRLASTGEHIATAGLAGSAIMIEASSPALLEALNLPGLSYAGETDSGHYKMPLLLGERLLSEDSIRLSKDLEAAIKKASTKVKPLKTDESFPWTLYPFQARDAAQGLRILETTGGVLLAGDMGSGKAVKLSTKVLTPTGTTLAGDVKKGDFLVGKDGKPTEVLGVFPQGERPMFELTFTDGYTAVADAEHRWSVHSPVMKKRGRPDKVMTTEEVLESGLRDGAGNLRWYIPMCEPIEFEERAPGDLPVPAYSLGALLGDGSLNENALGFASVDIDIVERLRSELGVALTLAPLSEAGRLERAALQGCAPGEVKDCQYRITGARALKEGLRHLGALGKRAWEKSIPDAYKYAPAQVRRDLLQGLLDTDGGPCDTRSPSSIEFSSTSEQLADDVAWLVQSLGGTARKSASRQTSYMYKGEKKLGRPSWRLSLQLPDHVVPFHCARKAGLYKTRVKYQPSRGIKSIEPVEAAEAVCFKVAAEDEMFLLEHAVVTKNTTISLAINDVMGNWPLLVVAPLSAFSTWDRQLGQMGKKSYLATDAPAKSWELIEQGGWDAVVVSYDRLHAFVEVIERYGFASIIADELQRIRTPGSRRSRAIRQLALSIPIRIGLSGTPLTNRLDDLLPLGAFLAPSEWKPRASTKELDDMYLGDPIESIADHLGALMVRRRMDDTGATLPNRKDRRLMIQLTPEQRKALAALEAEAEAAKEEGAFDDPGQKMHAFVRLQRMRQIVNCPSAAGVTGPNPKVGAAVDLAQDFLAEGRKGVIFCADRTTFRDVGKALDDAKIGWVGIWGATPPLDRIKNEKMFHNNDIAPNGNPTSVVLCTIQAGAESWSASPTGTWLISTAYVYAPSTLSQMECRVYRMNSDPNGPDIEIVYIHAQAPGGSLDDRMIEILEVKKQLFAQVVDRMVHVDNTQVHYSMADLVFLLTGKKDEALAKREADAKAAVDRETAMKEHAKKTIYKNKGANKRSDRWLDDGSVAKTLEEMISETDLDETDLLEEAPDALEAMEDALSDDDLTDDAEFDDGDD